MQPLGEKIGGSLGGEAGYHWHKEPERKKGRQGRGKRRRHRGGECGFFPLGHLEGHAAGQLRTQHSDSKAEVQELPRETKKQTEARLGVSRSPGASDSRQRAQKKCLCCCPVLLPAWVAAVFPSLLSSSPGGLRATACLLAPKEPTAPKPELSAGAWLYAPGARNRCPERKAAHLCIWKS